LGFEKSFNIMDKIDKIKLGEFVRIEHVQNILYKQYKAIAKTWNLFWTKI
jgi:hypothetical protein